MKSVHTQKIHALDATGKTPGRFATEIARILMGKNSAKYTPNVDSGNEVRVQNASKMKITDKKLSQKVYYRHTRHGQGLKPTTMKSLWTTDPADILRRSVSRMLPKNSFRNERMKRLQIEN